MTRSKDLKPGNALAATFRDQFLGKVPSIPSSVDLNGQTAIVTGASSGLGLETARQLLSLGLSRVILAVRSPERGQAAADKIRSANDKATIEVWPLEMESYESIQGFAERCKTDLDRLDAVVLNAGTNEMEFHISAATGHEKSMQVNYWGTMLLAVLLLPTMKAKAQVGVTPHLSVVSSTMSNMAKFTNREERPLLLSFDDTKITPWDPMQRYPCSKLLGQFFLSRLADHVSADTVIINMIEPGLVKGTELFREMSGLSRKFMGVYVGFVGRPVETGAITFINAAVVQGKDSHGSLLVNGKVAPLAPLTYGPLGKTISDVVWEETLDEFKFAGLRELLQSI